MPSAICSTIDHRIVTLDLFDENADAQQADLAIAPGATLLRGFALPAAAEMLQAVESILAQAPLRQLLTPSGLRMSVAMTNCGDCGWISDRAGYRYEQNDPQSGKPWPVLPAAFRTLAREAAGRAGFADFAPDACLVNQYLPGARMSLHQDRDEHDLKAPIVSVSFGLPAMFVFGGLKRADRTHRVPLQHGDVVVWGGPARLAFHGVLALKEGEHERLGRQRINLTFRRAF